MLTKFLEAVGGFVIRRFEDFGTIVLLYVETMKQLTHKPRIKHIVAQMSHLGVDSLTIVSLNLFVSGHNRQSAELSQSQSGANSAPCWSA